MVDYQYVCEKCLLTYTEERSIHQSHPEKCPGCGEKYGVNFHQDFAGVGAYVWAYGEPTTFGQQAELNSKRLGKEQIEKKEEVTNPPRMVPWWRKGLDDPSRPLNLNKISNLERYIHDGVK